MSSRTFWGIVIMSGAMVDTLGYVHLGPITANAALSAVIAFGLAGFAMDDPRSTWQRLVHLWPLSLLLLYSLSQCLWHLPSLQGYQNLCALWVFVGSIAYIATQTDKGLDSRYLARLQLIATGLAATAYTVQMLFDGLGSDAFIGSRSFALYMLVGQALLVGRWAHGSRTSLWLAIGLTLLVAFSLSRTALVVSVLLFPLARLRSLSFRGVARVAVIGSLAAVALFYLVTSNGALSSRFLGGQSIQDYIAGDAAVDTSGRLEFWAVTWDSLTESPWLGKGPGTANDLISETFDNISHPHNEYLRILHDEGILGLGLFLLGSFQLLRVCWREYCRLAEAQAKSASLTLGILLALVAVLLTMLTDNTASYIYVVAPLAALVGSVCLEAKRAPNLAIKMRPAFRAAN